MAMTCVSGARECDGCMRCQKDPAVIGHCSVCKDEILKTDDHYDIDGTLLHEDCLQGWARQFLTSGG